MLLVLFLFLLNIINWEMGLGKFFILIKELGVMWIKWLKNCRGRVICLY